MLTPMADAATDAAARDAPSAGTGARYVQNADVQWNMFSPVDYWHHNYSELQPEDREIIQQVSEFFIGTLGNRPVGQRRVRGIDVGSGTNLYPALLMIPWVDQILLTDFSARNIDWLFRHVTADSDAWTWDPFWGELRGREHYNQIGDPHKRLREACHAHRGHAGIEKHSVFKLPTRRWDVGTMFFVAESITESPEEFRAALEGFLGALKVGAPFATAFMAGSNGYSVANKHFPALSIRPDDVVAHFAQLGAYKLNVNTPLTDHRVRDGYSGMIVATGFVGERLPDRRAMEIQTRRHILEIWRATVEHCYRDGKWHWGGRSGRNSISDAEQLLTILYPATIIESLKVDSVDQTADDVLEYMHGLGNALDIPRHLIEFIGEYMRTYLVDETPDFAGSSYFQTEDDRSAPNKQQEGLHIVDSYSMSVTLCLATLGFLRIYRRGLRSSRMLRTVDELEAMCAQRLTAAMVGLLRSFAVNTFDPGDPPGQVLLGMLNQGGSAPDLLLGTLLDQLAEIRAGLRQELTIGLGQTGEELENGGRLFECGWSWGVVDGAPEVVYASDIGNQPTGVAEARPYLYFTVVALEGIQDLFSERTRVLGLLNEEQQRLARALQLRWDLTRQFWARVATFGDGRWPLEDVPWITTDGRESDYYSLLLSSIIIQGGGNERMADVDIQRVGVLLEELANRGRITRRLTHEDPAVALHIPGMAVRLIGSEKVAGGPRLQWMVSSFSLLVLKRLLRVAELLDDNADRVRTLNLADEMWRHIERRKMEGPAARGLWDQPTQAFASTSTALFDKPSWYHTERVVEVLVAAANVTQSPPTPADRMTENAEQLLAEAEHLFDQERLRGTNDTGEQMRDSFQSVDAKLRRARELLRDRPGTASVLAGDVLRDLDMVDAARQDTARMS
jgi:NNMT/PNMT/TEMT family